MFPRPTSFPILFLALLALGASIPGFAAPPTVGSNVQIGIGADIQSVSLGRDAASGALFALERTLSGALASYRSTNSGASWDGMFAVAAGATSADLAVVGGYGYVCSAEAAGLRMRRFVAASGALDAVYGAKTLAPPPGTPIVELVAVGNGDDDADLVACAVILESGLVGFFYASAATGTPFYEVPPAINDADSGLALAWRTGCATSDEDALLLAYVSTAKAIRVYRLDLFGWDDGQSVATSQMNAWTTTLSASGPHAVVGFESSGDHGQDVAQCTSPDVFESWTHGIVGDAPAGGDFSRPLVSARSRTGVAYLLQQETGALDSMQFLERHGYGAAAFSEPLALNDFDYAGGANGFDFDWLEAGWGLAYRDTSNRAWFAFSRSIRYSGFESGDLSEWSASTGGE